MNSSDPVGTVRTLWRFPVKSMLGEQVGVVEVGEGGIIGDRAYAVRDRQTGKVANAKNPKLWPGLLACRAAFVEPLLLGDELPPVRIDLADGDSVLSDASDADAVLSRFFGRDVELARAAQHGYTIDQYQPDEENYDPGGHRDEVVEARMGAALFDEMGLPSAVADGSFFDAFPLSVLENEWLGRRLAIGDDVRIAVAMPDPRCVMPSLAQQELPRDPGILKALGHKRIDVGGSLYPCAGVYAVVEAPGTMRGNDRVSLI